MYDVLVCLVSPRCILSFCVLFCKLLTAYELRISDCISDVCFSYKQKTAYEMRISDWSSVVCSSDLAQQQLARVPEFFQRFGDDAARVQRRRDGRGVVAGLGAAVEGGRLTRARRAARLQQDDMLVFATRAADRGAENGRAACRE